MSIVTSTLDNNVYDEMFQYAIEDYQSGKYTESFIKFATLYLMSNGDSDVDQCPNIDHFRSASCVNMIINTTKLETVEKFTTVIKEGLQQKLHPDHRQHLESLL